jgi:hypothetical protein
VGDGKRSEVQDALRITDTVGIRITRASDKALIGQRTSDEIGRQSGVDSRSEYRRAPQRPPARGLRSHMGAPRSARKLSHVSRVALTSHCVVPGVALAACVHGITGGAPVHLVPREAQIVNGSCLTVRATDAGCMAIVPYDDSFISAKFGAYESPQVGHYQYLHEDITAQRYEGRVLETVVVDDALYIWITFSCKKDSCAVSDLAKRIPRQRAATGRANHWETRVETPSNASVLTVKDDPGDLGYPTIRRTTTSRTLEAGALQQVTVVEERRNSSEGPWVESYRNEHVRSLDDVVGPRVLAP